MKEIHVYEEVDQAAAEEAIAQAESASGSSLWSSSLVREVAGAIAEAREQGRRECHVQVSMVKCLCGAEAKLGQSVRRWWDAHVLEVRAQGPLPHNP